MVGNTDKTVSYGQALGLIQNGQSIMFGGFGDAGYPFEFVRRLSQTDVRHLTVIGNDGGMPGDSKGAFYTSGKVDKLRISFCGLNRQVGQMYAEGRLDIEFIPQGTLAERIRCGGFGLGGVLTPTGIGTLMEEGRQVITVQGKEYLLEEPIRADVAVLRAKKADRFGNLVFDYTARNYSPLMAMAADVVIAEVGELVDTGSLNVNEIMVSGIFVDYLIPEAANE